MSLVSEKQGLTGLLQSPVRGAERAGLPGMLSGTRLNFSPLTRSHIYLTTILLSPYRSFATSNFLDVSN
jgi:hypothetical protein